MAKLIIIIVIVLLVLTVQGNEQGNIYLGQSITLHCPIRAKGRGLFVKSITWSKDGQEFYKYDPDMSPYAIILYTEGVQVEEDVFFNGTRITIGPASPQTAGLYTCIAELSNSHFPGLRFLLNVDTELTFKSL